ncbi:MAG: DUF4232 domain-containing protein [Actinobacteria bacterium]|nr:MAG: DUF4232 domain-containing protein [Actinomycetota bacterium]
MADWPRGVVVGAAFAALAGGCTSGNGHRGAVPWVNRPLPPYAAPQPRPISYSTSAPACDAAQLRVTRGRGGVATGHLFERFVFTNTGSTPCLLRGYPTVSADAPDGRRVVLHPRLGSTFAGSLSPSDLAAGGHVFLDFGTSDCGCTCLRPHPTRYRYLAFGLPHGGAVRGGRLTLIKDCYLEMTGFGLPERLAEPRAKPGTAGTLRALLRLPRTVRAGTVLRYTVELVNPTSRTVTLSPCPSYTEATFTPTAHTARRFRLNCESVHAIPAHGHTRYAIQLAVPRDASGFAKLGWHLDTPTGPFAAGAVQIVAA